MRHDGRYTVSIEADFFNGRCCRGIYLAVSRRTDATQTRKASAKNRPKNHLEICAHIRVYDWVYDTTEVLQEPSNEHVHNEPVSLTAMADCFGKCKYDCHAINKAPTQDEAEHSGDQHSDDVSSPRHCARIVLQ